MLDRKRETDGHGINWVIFGLADRYKVSENGDIMSRIVSTPKRKVKGVEVFRGWKPLKAMFKRTDYTKAGYLKVSVKLRLKGHEQVYVHRLVAENFITKVNGKYFVNHIDGNRMNNNVANLEWCTHAENIANAKERGSFLYDNSPEKSLDWAQMLTAITLINSNFGISSISRHYNVLRKALDSARKGVDFSFKCYRGLINQEVKMSMGRAANNVRRIEDFPLIANSSMIIAKENFQ